MRTFGPVARFDPHPAGPAVDHGRDGPAVLYGSLLFDTAVIERLARDPRRRDLVDLCPAVRGSLIEVSAGAGVHDLTDTGTCDRLGADPALGDAVADDAYAVTQAWGRHLHATDEVAGVRYFSARHRTADGGRHGINVALWRPQAIGRVVGQHRLVDDALWPHVVVALDAAGMGVNLVEACPVC